MSLARCSSSLLSALCLSSIAIAQVTFATPKIYSTGVSPTSVVAADFNHDGIKDIAVTSGPEHRLYVHYGNADGSYSPGLSFQVCGNPIKIVSGDFNHDGIPDLAMLNSPRDPASSGCPGTKPSVSIFLGAPGGFSAPRNIALDTAAVNDIGAGDLDGNGFSDLAIQFQMSDLTPIVHTIRFFAGGAIQEANTTLPRTDDANEIYSRLALADFNVDAKVDLAITYIKYGDDPSTRHAAIFPGNGDGTFTPTIVASFNDVIDLKVGDINNDGRPDLLAVLVNICEPETTCTETVAAFPNGGGWQFDYMKIASHSNDALYTQVGDYHEPIVGDFNGDGRDDVAFLARFFLEDLLLVSIQSLDPSTHEPIFLPPRKTYLGSDLVVAGLAWTRIAGTSSLPDVAITAQRTDQFLTVKNTTDMSGGAFCTVPSGPGIHICSPTVASAQSNSVKVVASARLTTTTPDALVYRFEIWEGGTKLYTERDSEQLYASLPLSNGSHTLTLIARDNTGSIRMTNKVTLTVGTSTCSPPASVGVNVCEPANGATVSSPFAAKAYAKVNGSIYRFSVWDGNTKLYEVRDSSVIDTVLSLPAGTHKLTWEARNSDGSSRGSAQTTVTLK